MAAIFPPRLSNWGFLAGSGTIEFSLVVSVENQAGRPETFPEKRQEASWKMDPPREFLINLPSQIAVPLMERMTPKSSDPFINMTESSIPLMAQTENDFKIRMKQKNRTSFTKEQHEELETVFSHTMYLDKNLQNIMASKLNLPQSSVKNWFKNRRQKWRKNQQKESLNLSNQNLSGKKMPNLSKLPINASFSAHTHLLSSSNWAQDSITTQSFPSDNQMQDLQLENLEPSVPALFSGAYDITQIMKLYSFPDEDELSTCSFNCLYQYLSPTEPHIEQVSSFSSLVAQVVDSSAKHS
ncbi:arginine-fifty homeobox [Suncus etruscus]|uniref:arginine-fifty homeobox n=1 Tax=Suncus etruscus TaxID=109475 RepID=UPI00210FA901|nr:arginine-fifty homeobox [Suncus etruscus]